MFRKKQCCGSETINLGAGSESYLSAVFGIRIRIRIRPDPKLFGLKDPDPDPK